MTAQRARQTGLCEEEAGPVRLHRLVADLLEHRPPELRPSQRVLPLPRRGPPVRGTRQLQAALHVAESLYPPGLQFAEVRGARLRSVLPGVAATSGYTLPGYVA